LRCYRHEGFIFVCFQRESPAVAVTLSVSLLSFTVRSRSLCLLGMTAWRTFPESCSPQEFGTAPKTRSHESELAKLVAGRGDCCRLSRGSVNQTHRLDRRIDDLKEWIRAEVSSPG